jgi:regulator of sigma E protease
LGTLLGCRQHRLVPIIADPAPDTCIQPGCRVGRNRFGGWRVTQSWAEVSMALASRLGDSGSISIEIAARQQRTASTECRSNWQRGADEPELFRSLGMVPTLAPILGTILDDGPAKAAGFQSGDRVTSVDGKPIKEWADWVDVLRAAPGKSLTIEFERGSMRDRSC